MRMQLLFQPASFHIPTCWRVRPLSRPCHIQGTQNAKNQRRPANDKQSQHSFNEEQQTDPYLYRPEPARRLLVPACTILLIYFTTRGFKPFGFNTTFPQESWTDVFIGHDKAPVLVLHGNESFQVDV